MQMNALAQEYQRLLQDNKRLMEQLEEQTSLFRLCTHQLKNPLIGLFFNVNRYREDPTAERQESIQEQCKTISHMLSRMMFLSSLNHDVHYERQHIEIDLLCKDLYASTQGQDSRHTFLYHDRTSTAPAVAVVVKDLIIEALSILLHNAATYTPAGSTITLTIRRDPRQITIIIEDNGPGVPDAVLAHLGKPLEDTAGSGLGLSIVDKIARIHHGSFSLSNKPSGGAQAVLVLPLA
ncbi:hypothetical protein H6771_02745 [Candidatus Peribacteria bacterium]|nr:hypothetical protein [Candidatus Peribacteria bacterium]